MIRCQSHAHFVAGDLADAQVMLEKYKWLSTQLDGAIETLNLVFFIG